MTGFKTYRHDSNPDEKLLHDTFVENFSRGISMEQISLHCNDRGEPDTYLTDREKRIIISTVQWLGSPVGDGFLRKCGYIKKQI